MVIETPWPVCNACQSIPLALFLCSKSDSRSESYLLHDTFLALHASASRGCHTCTLFYEAVRDPFKSRLETQPVYVESTTTDGGNCAIAVTVDASISDLSTGGDKSVLQTESAKGLDCSFRFTPVAEVKIVKDYEKIPPEARNHKDMLSLFPEDEGAISYIRQSLNRCLADHGSVCNRVHFPHSAQDEQRAPTTHLVHGKNGLVGSTTRLVYVGAQDERDPPRVVNGKNCLFEGGYLALSYCNGNTPKQPPWQLTTANLEEFERRLPLEVLPQTLHDGIVWTRKLGERYIWIDELCILQDSADDWNREASRMASIYGNAVLTLVAASGSVYGGMTDRRNPLKNSAACLSLRDSDGRAETVYVLPNGQKRSNQAPAPTDARGWCYQEDLLSSRLVKMTLTQVIWECTGRNQPPSRAQGLEQLRAHPPFRWYTIWYRLIERYSGKQVTYASDKLPAISGIAADKSGPTYLAGAWRGDIWVGLLWCRNEHQVRLRPGRRYKEYIAPSWSWASIDVPVLFYEAQGRAWRKPQLESSPHDPILHGAGVTPGASADVWATSDEQPSTYKYTLTNTAEESSSFRFSSAKDHIDSLDPTPSGAQHSQVGTASETNPYYTGPVSSGFIDITASSLLAVTTSQKQDLLRQNQSYLPGRRRLLALGTSNIVVGEIVFDIVDEAQDNLILRCSMLHVSAMDAWLKNDTIGLGIAMRLRGVSKGQTEWERVGYVQFVSTANKHLSRMRSLCV